jgi:maltose-binding protein MalE
VFSIIFRQQMLNTKYVLMFVVLSAGMLTGLTATGMSQGQTAFANEENNKERYCKDNYNNNCNDVKQKLEQENKCKIQNENSNERHSDGNTNNINTGEQPQEVNCGNQAQNAGQDASAHDDAFNGPSEGPG